MIFLYRLIKQILKFIVFIWPLQLIGACLLLVYLPFHYKKVSSSLSETIRLPKYLRWFDCADLYPEFNRNPITYMSTVFPKGWWAVYCCLSWRNPLNYFSYKHLAFSWSTKACIKTNGKWAVGDSKGKVAGLYWIEVKHEETNKVYYEYYYVKKWDDNHCLRFRMGWKIGDSKLNVTGERQQDCFVLSPYKSYTGK